MSKFLERFGLDVEVEEVDLDAGDVTFRGEVLTESRADELAAEVLARAPGRPSLSGAREPSPSLTIRLPQQERARLDRLAASQGRKTAELVREALQGLPRAPRELRGAATDMHTVPLGETKDRLSDLVDRVQATREVVTITRLGRPAVVMMTVDDLESLEEALFLSTLPES